MKSKLRKIMYASVVLSTLLQITPVFGETVSNYNQPNVTATESKQSEEPNKIEESREPEVIENPEKPEVIEKPEGSLESEESRKIKENRRPKKAKKNKGSKEGGTSSPKTQETSIELQNPNMHPEEIRSAYDAEVKKGKIDPSKNSFETYSNNYRKNFNTFLSMRSLDPDLSYRDWYEKWCNNGASPSGEGYVEKSNMTTFGCTSTQAANAQRFRNDIQPGDIVVITNGAIGHAAIATSRNYILEMTGSRNVYSWFNGTLYNNNNQYVIEDWLFPADWATHGYLAQNHISENIEIWRLNNRAMARQVASYADRHYFNSYGGSQRNISITYQLTAQLYRQNPNYCSKLVYQAFYYGSGSAPVVKPKNAWVLPYELKSMFNSSYGYSAYKVGSY